MNEPSPRTRPATAGGATTSTPAWLARTCLVVPAYDAARTLPAVVEDLRAALPECEGSILVVDDGSTDGTGALATELGCRVVAHGRNRGKGAALRTGLATAEATGHLVAITVDADGQHRGADARELVRASADPEALVLGIRDLAGAGAPRANRFSNGISNAFLSRFAGRTLHDTQCGLRRYPVARALALGTRGEGYDFEAEVLLRAVWSGVPVVEQAIQVIYPEDRTTHFHVVRDPWRIIRTVVRTLAEHRRRA